MVFLIFLNCKDNEYGIYLIYLFDFKYDYMKEIRLEVNMKVVSLEELTENELNLIEVAKEATSQAYAPYSKFHVGAAVLRVR